MVLAAGRFGPVGKHLGLSLALFFLKIGPSVVLSKLEKLNLSINLCCVLMEPS